MTEPLVGIIMGSSSDWETMRHAAETLDQLGVAHETKIVSAHRTPKRLYDYAHSAKERGLKVVIAGAGGAAHLPGMAASMTSLPVLGVPVESQALKGIDSLLSIVQMPAGSAGRNARDRQGRRDQCRAARGGDAGDQRRCALAAAARGLARRADRIGGRSARMTEAMIAPGATIGIIGGGQLGRMLAIAAAQLGYRCHIFDPHEHPPARQMSPPAVTRAAFDDVDALRELRRARSTSPPTSSRICRSRRSTCSADKLQPVDPLARDRPGPRAARKHFIEGTRRAGRAVALGVDASKRSQAAVAELGTPIVLKTRRYGYDGKGQAWIRVAARSRSRVESDRRGARGRRSWQWTSSPNSRSSSRAGTTVATLSGTRPRTSIATASCAARPCPAASASRARSPKPAKPRCGSPRRSAMSACSPSNSSQPPTARSSTRSHRASTTAATGRSRARSPRSSSSTSAPSAACRRASPG